MSERFTEDSIDADIEELLSPDANGDDAHFTRALATLYAPPGEAETALERVHARVLNGLNIVAGPASVEPRIRLLPPQPHQRLKGRLSALGAVAAVILVTLLAVSLFSRGPRLRVGSQPTATVLVPLPTVSLPTPIPVRTPQVSVFDAPGGPVSSEAVGPDGSLAYIVGVGSGYAVTNHNPELVYVSPTGKVTTFPVPTVAGTFGGADITMDSNGSVMGNTYVYISATKSVKNVTWLLDPRSGAVKDLPGGYCPYLACTLGPDGFFWIYSFSGTYLGIPTGYYPGVISRMDPDTNRTVSQTPVPAWIRSHVTITAQETTLLFFGVGSGGLTWFSVFYASHIWLASFNVSSGAFHTVELPESFTTQPATGSSGPVPAELIASTAEDPVVAPDGSLWDVLESTACLNCEHDQSTIYHYTPDGQLTSYPNPLLGDGYQQGGQPVSGSPDAAALFVRYVSDQYSNLCTVGVSSNGVTFTYRCFSPHGAVLTFGQVARESIANVGGGQFFYTNYHSLWFVGQSGVALIEFST